jgi:hypothetical protein
MWGGSMELCRIELTEKEKLELFDTIRDIPLIINKIAIKYGKDPNTVRLIRDELMMIIINFMLGELIEYNQGEAQFLFQQMNEEGENDGKQG